MNILVAGYSYIRDAHRNTFNFYPKTDNIFFLLPKQWRARGGSVVFNASSGNNIFTTNTFFYHSRYPLVRGLLKGWMPAFPLILWKLKRTQQVSLVYSCSEPTLLSTLYNGIWAKLLGVKHVPFTWENIPYRFGGPKGLFRKLILWLNFLFADGVICGNEKGRQIYHPLTKKPLVVVPLFGLDFIFFTPGKSSRIFNNYDLTDKLVFTFAGAVAYRKGVHHIINALRAVVAEFPKACLIIAGNDEYGGELEKIIQRAGMQNNVIRFSWLSHQQLKGLLAISDVFLYPSLSYRGWEEQFGYAMAEASLMEVPVISTATGSIEDVVINEKTGLIIKSDSEEETIGAMSKLAGDADLRIKLGKAGRQYIIEHFSQKAVAKKFFDFFHSI